MSPDADSANASQNGSEVLANLPRHRPGRRTSRRTEAATSRAQAGSTSKRGAGAKSSRATGGAGTSSRATGTASRATRSGAGSRSGSRSGATRGSSRPSTAAPRRAAPTARSTGIPLQGFELEADARRGSAVEPPSRLELASSVVELVGEGVEGLVRASVSAGGSLIKRTLELIPHP